MAFKTRLRDGILSYVYHKIAEEGHFLIRIPEDFLQHVLNPFLSYYMTQISVKVNEGSIKITGSSLVPVNLTLKTPIVRDEEIVIPVEMNQALYSFASTFGVDRLKPIRLEQNSLIIPAELIYNAAKDIAEDLKISQIEIKDGELIIEIVSR